VKLKLAVPFVAVHAWDISSKPFAETVIVPDGAGIPSNEKAPDRSVTVTAEYDPAISLTFAPGTAAALASRTTPCTRVPSGLAATGENAEMAPKTRPSKHPATTRQTNRFWQHPLTNRLKSLGLRRWSEGVSGVEFIARYYSVTSVIHGDNGHAILPWLRKYKLLPRMGLR